MFSVLDYVTNALLP